MAAEDKKEEQEDQKSKGAADEEEGEEGEASKAKSGGNSSKLIIIILAVALVISAGAAAFLFVSQKEAPTEEGTEIEVEAPKGHGKAPVEASSVNVYYYELPEILVNLSSAGSASRFLKIKLNLELNSELDVPVLEKVLPRVIDDFQVYLRQLRVEDLTGSAGIYRLKEALLLRANQSAQPLEINNVLFKEILVQ